MKNKDKNLEHIKRLLLSAENNIKAAKVLLSEMTGKSVDFNSDYQELPISGDGKVIEGEFNGENMEGDNGEIYPIPANYASKSKLVEGDRLKLTIVEDGTFIFKQISPTERKKLIGKLEYENNQYSVLAGKTRYNVLKASITYFKGTPGDEVTIIIPEGKKSQWAAVEAIISKT